MKVTQSPQWRRRDVLVLGPAGFAAVTAGPRLAAWSAALGLPLTAMAGEAATLSIAYVAGGENSRDGGEKDLQSAARLIDARMLPAGDPGLADQGVRLSIRGGFDPCDVPEPGLPSLSIDVDFQPFQNCVYHAWRFDAGSLPGMASPVTFPVPISADAGLNLVVDAREAAVGEAYRHQLRFTTGTEPGVPRLRTGNYLLTWPHLQSGLLSAWAGCYWCDQSESLVRRDWRRDRMVPAGVPYVVLSVERADEDAA